MSCYNMLAGIGAKSVNNLNQESGASNNGEANERGDLLSAVYNDLRRLAAYKLANEAAGQTLQATALVHEAWLRIEGGGGKQQWQNRAHFFGAAAEAMRRVLIENARRKSRLKRGGEAEKIPLESLEIASPMPDDELLALNESLDRLEKINDRAARVVKLCFFAGLTQEQAARELHLSIATVERDWAFARAWLFRDIREHQNPPS